MTKPERQSRRKRPVLAAVVVARIRAARRRALAQDIGLSAKAVSRFLAGRGEPSVKLLEGLAHRFDVPQEDLLADAREGHLKGLPGRPRKT